MIVVIVMMIEMTMMRHICVFVQLFFIFGSYVFGWLIQILIGGYEKGRGRTELVRHGDEVVL